MYKYLINFCYSKASQNFKYAGTINLTVNHYMCLRLTAVHCNNGISTFCEFSLKNVISIVTSSHVSVHPLPTHTHTHTQNRIPLICYPWDQKTGARLPNIADYQKAPTLTYDFTEGIWYFIMAPIVGLHPIRGVFNWTSPSATGSLKFRRMCTCQLLLFHNKKT